MKRKLLILFLLVPALFFTQTGCGKIKDLTDATARLSAQVENFSKKNEESYRENLYGKETTLRVAKILRDKVIPLTKNFNSAVRKLAAKYKGANKIPVSELNKLRADFAVIETEIGNVLEIVGALTVSQRAMVDAAIAAIKQAIALIGDTFSLADDFTEGGYVRWQA